MQRQATSFHIMQTGGGHISDFIWNCNIPHKMTFFSFFFFENPHPPLFWYNLVARIHFLQLTFLQTTGTSKVDICTKRGISGSHYMAISHLSHQEVDRMEGVFTNKAGCQKADQSSSHTTGHFSGQLWTFPAIFVVTVLVVGIFTAVFAPLKLDVV